MMNTQEIMERLNREDHFAQRCGIRLTSLKEGYAETEVTITDELRNGVGVLQGGVTFTLADFAFAGASTANPEGKIYVAMGAEIHFLRPGIAGKARGVCRIINRTRHSCLGDAEVFNEQGKMMAKLTITGFEFNPERGNRT